MLAIYKNTWFCRWCGKAYKPQQQTERDGFCCTAHKQAHHRAFKNYVTAHQRSVTIAGQPVTQKKKMKKKAAQITKQGPRRRVTQRGMIKT